MSPRSYEKDYLVQMDISVEMNLDHVTLARTGYTTLDVLSDVGGIQSILMSAMAMLLSVWNYNHFDNYMASRLYQVERASPPDSSSRKTTTRAEYRQMEPWRFLNICEWLYDHLPSCFKSKRCRKMQRMREFQKARDELTSEINIIEIVRSRRLIYQALLLLLTPE